MFREVKSHSTMQGRCVMATTGRRRRKGESTMGYFKTILKASPHLLAGKSNKELMERWRRDHPGHTEVDERKANQSLANTKSTLRRAQREAGSNHQCRSLAN